MPKHRPFSLSSAQHLFSGVSYPMVLPFDGIKGRVNLSFRATPTAHSCLITNIQVAWFARAGRHLEAFVLAKTHMKRSC